MAFFRRTPEKIESKGLAVGVLNPVKTLDPRDAQDTVSVFVPAQIFEPPYAPPADAEDAAPAAGLRRPAAAGGAAPTPGTSAPGSCSPTARR